MSSDGTAQEFHNDHRWVAPLEPSPVPVIDQASAFPAGDAREPLSC